MELNRRKNKEEIRHMGKQKAPITKNAKRKELLKKKNAMELAVYQFPVQSTCLEKYHSPVKTTCQERLMFLI